MPAVTTPRGLFSSCVGDTPVTNGSVSIAAIGVIVGTSATFPVSFEKRFWRGMSGTSCHAQVHRGGAEPFAWLPYWYDGLSPEIGLESQALGADPIDSLRFGGSVVDHAQDLGSESPDPAASPAPARSP